MSTNDRKITWFQTRINHFILGTNSLVSKITVSVNDRCTFCKSQIETIEHLFWECEKTQNLLVQFEALIETKQIQLNYNKQSFILGYSSRNINILLKNNQFLLWLKSTKQNAGEAT